MKVAILPGLPDLLQCAITIVDAQEPDQPVVWCNPAFERLTGYTSAEIVGRNMRLLQGPDTQPATRAALRSAIAAGRACTAVIRNYRKDGSAFWSEVRISPVRDAAGTVTHFIGEQSNVTDREENLRALRDSEARFRAVLEAAPDATLLTDGEGRIILVNERLELLFGYTRAELLGKSVSRLMPPDLRTAHEAKIAQFTSAPRARMMGAGRQLFACRKDGSIFASDISLNAMTMGTEVIVLAAIRDVTERQEAEDRLIASEANFRDLAELAPAGIFRRDTNFRLIFGNPTFFAISGLAATETGQDDLLRHLHPDDRAEARSTQDQALREPAPPIELRYLHSDGTITWALGRAAPQLGPDGRVTGIMGTLTDITAIKHAEAAVREQAALLDLARDAIVERGLDQRVIFWNDGAARLYGWSREEALGKRSADLFVPASELENLDKVWENVLRHGEWHGELQLQARDGRKLVVQSSWTLVRDAAGQPKAALSIDTDLTERRALELQMFRSQRMESVGTMAGGIAHDLNNVLQPILLSVAFLKSGVTDPQQLAMLDLLSSSAQRGADLIRQVLTFARGAEGERVPVHLAGIVQDAIRVVRETCPKNITVSTEWAEGIWKVSADATQLHQVAMNLCLNAADAMPNGGTITVSVENTEIDEQFARMHLDAVAGSYVTLCVSDTGTGMSAEVLDRIFEPFFTTKGAEKGTGLGLSTVHAIVKAHGGFVRVYSEPGVGTTFSVYLPATGDTSISAEATAEHRVHLAEVAGRGELILVVDDEEAIREVTRMTLEKYGYGVLTAADGVQALALFADAGSEIDAVLTDILMPALGGDVLIDVVRRLDPAVKVIAMSGLAHDTRGPANAASARVPFLHKPYTAEQLLDALAKLLRA